ncbi:MAG TPA: TolC family protein, partial [Hyphomicrobiaceae bacterium]|nr:TolC family protein [Hyphomicrobiaceae bacterium]
MKTKFLTMALISCTLIAGGCAASLSPAPAFEDVAINVKQRTGKAISWDAGGKDDLRARAHVDRLLKRQLSAASAIQVALLNNKSLQATYAGLGVAQADLVQAGLLSNPILDVSALWPYQPQTAAANVTAGVVVNFIELFWKRYKQAVAESVLAEAKIRVSGMVIDHASTTNLAFIDYVASKQEIGLLKQVVNAARATVASAKAIREAGNSTPLDFELQQNVLTQAKLELASVEARLAGEREKLNVLMGTSGKQTRWHAPSRL